MKRLTLLLCLVLTFPLTARADDAAKRAKVQEMLDLLHLDRLMDQMMDMVQKQASSMTDAQMNGKGVPPEQKERFDAFQKQLFTFIQTQLSWKAMESDYVDMYSQTFTEEEIDAMIAFYKSPAGQSMIAKTPELTQKSSVLVQKKMVTLIPQMQKMVQDFASTAAKRDSQKLDTN